MPNDLTAAEAMKKPETAKALYQFLVKIGQIPPEKQLPPDKVDEFFGVKSKDKEND